MLQASSLRFEPWGMIWCAVCTRVKQVTCGVDLDHRNGRTGDRDGARHGGADDRGGANSGERVMAA
jgi:hypothetical protein